MTHEAAWRDEQHNKEFERLKKENARLRQALAEYADPRNWIGQYPGDSVRNVWCGLRSNGPDGAKEALKDE